VRAVVLVTASSALLFALGLFTRVFGVVAWLGFRTLADLNNHSGGAYDELVKNELFLLLLSGCGSALSLDALRTGARNVLVPAWPRYLLVFQLALMYWSTGMQKVSDGWVPGGHADALWYILQQPTWQRMEMTWMAPFYAVTRSRPSAPGSSSKARPSCSSRSGSATRARAPGACARPSTGSTCAASTSPPAWPCTSASRRRWRWGSSAGGASRSTSARTTRRVGRVRAQALPDHYSTVTSVRPSSHVAVMPSATM